MRRYKDFRLKYREEDPRDVFCNFSFVTQSGGSWEYPYEKLAEIAQPENWGFTREEFKSRYPQQTHPILMNYLNYTFLRLQDLNLIEYMAVFLPSFDRAQQNKSRRWLTCHYICQSMFRNNTKGFRTDSHVSCSSIARKKLPTF